MIELSRIRVAWLLPIIGTRSVCCSSIYKVMPETVVYTELWPGYAPGCEGAIGGLLSAACQLPVIMWCWGGIVGQRKEQASV